ncbi:MAG TPA: hypothetical protein VK208_00025 [Pyrinomonadaceae bacterium]|jgi:hypothetical protein|nr:hypothetical protein [Pyrinomonadaceae bacterium]
MSRASYQVSQSLMVSLATLFLPLIAFLATPQPSGAVAQNSNTQKPPAGQRRRNRLHLEFVDQQWPPPDD